MLLPEAPRGDTTHTAEFPRQPQAVTRFANAQTATTAACTRSLLKLNMAPGLTVETNWWFVGDITGDMKGENSKIRWKFAKLYVS